jgi:hypothetical protein
MPEPTWKLLEAITMYRSIDSSYTHGDTLTMYDDEGKGIHCHSVRTLGIKSSLDHTDDCHVMIRALTLLYAMLLRHLERNLE